MSNIAWVIKSHISKLLGEDYTSTASNTQCSCRKKDLCLRNGACRVNNIRHKATVTTKLSDTRVYIGMSENTFKTRFNNHRVSFKHQEHSQNTVLSKYIWDLKDSNADFSVGWSIVTRASFYRGNNLTLQFMPDWKALRCIRERSTLLNKRSELITKCRHENKFYASQTEAGSLHAPFLETLELVLNFIPTAINGTV